MQLFFFFFQIQNRKQMIKVSYTRNLCKSHTTARTQNVNLINYFKSRAFYIMWPVKCSRQKVNKSWTRRMKHNCMSIPLLPLRPILFRKKLPELRSTEPGGATHKPFLSISPYEQSSNLSANASPNFSSSLSVVVTSWSNNSSIYSKLTFVFRPLFKGRGELIVTSIQSQQVV